MNRLVINARESEKRMIWESNGEIIKVYIEQPDQMSCVGNIYLGIVESISPGMNAAFVNIGEGRKGFLHLSQLPAIYHEGKMGNKRRGRTSLLNQGEKLIVQVIKDETETKHYKLTGNIELTSRAAVYMPYGNYVAVSKKLPEDQRRDLKEWGEEIKMGQEGILFRTACAGLTNEEILRHINELRHSFTALLKKTQNVKAPHPLFIYDHFLQKL